MPLFIVILAISILSVAGPLLNTFVSHDSAPKTYTPPMSIPSPSSVAFPSPLPTVTQGQSSLQIDCIGPDGVHFKTTQKACDDLNDFWKNPNQPKPTVVNDGWMRKIVGEHTTETEIPVRDDHMATPDELFQAVNSYKQSQAIPTIEKNDTLCTIAQGRAKELQQIDRLDGHAGFNKYVQAQREFSNIAEVTFDAAGKPLSGVHIVEYGWDRSLTGHRDALQDRTLTHGCGGVAGYFAVFIFGAK